uniref:Putative site-specific DNA endonuclease n=1 Tax=Stigeoclonium helveticum TaxID=55999 RepID=Q06SC4_STIHE|nr:putative site-specific DNA endonuclease [Stigeoclonium helveticum]ABF60224.1 putative site-specific DNA endonuclease [Stigeoclonium helveticum]
MARASTIKLTDHQKQVVMGTILGDAAIGFSGGKNARVQMNHSCKQRHYVVWKYYELETVCSRRSFSIKKPDRGSYSKRKKLRIQTLVSPDLTIINNLIKVNGKKTVTKEYLELLEPLAIAVWWCDDGSITGGYRQGTLCTHSMTKEEVLLIQQFFLEKWEINAKIMEVTPPNQKKSAKEILDLSQENITVCDQKTLDPTQEPRKKPYYALNFHTANAEKLIELIIPFIPVKQMIYKTFLKFNDSKNNARWRSFLASHYVPRFFNSKEEFEVYMDTHWQNVRSR